METISDKLLEKSTLGYTLDTEANGHTLFTSIGE
jgi:hypothetical protein